MNQPIHNQLEQLRQQLERSTPQVSSDRSAQWKQTQWLRAVDDQQLSATLDVLLEASSDATADNVGLLSSLFMQLVQRQHGGRGPQLSPPNIARLEKLYQQLGADHAARHLLLAVLAASGGEAELQGLAELLAADPPEDSTAVAVALSPLFQYRGHAAAALFPRMLDAIGHRHAAATVLDLANYLTREQQLTVHPAVDRVQQLAELLGNVVQQLAQLEEHPERTQGSPQPLREQVSEGITLAISLCDALALIGDAAAIGKLYQAMQLTHRRLRTEAAAALARLGDETGRRVLVEMAEHAVVRLRVLAYADELGVAEQVEPQYRSDQARAEAELALWLAQPAQLGYPPDSFELVDQQTLYWPGYEEPVDCYLLRFTYQLQDQQYSNIGIAGPLVYAFHADLGDLPPEQIYAAFAGWQAEHEEIREWDAAQLPEALQPHLARLVRRLRDAGYDAIQPVTLGDFFGDRMLVAHATLENTTGTAAVDNQHVQWYPTTLPTRSIGPHEAACIWKGRRLLRSFNP